MCIHIQQMWQSPDQQLIGLAVFDQPTPVPCAVTLGDSSECQRAGFSRERSDHQFFTEMCFEETQMKRVLTVKAEQLITRNSEWT